MNGKKALKQLEGYLGTLLSWLLMLFLLVLVGLTSLQVANRFLIKQPMPWISDVMMVVFAWLIFLGTAIGVQEKQHLAIDMVSSKLSTQGKKWLKYFIEFLLLLTITVILIASISFVKIGSQQKLATLDLPITILYSSGVVSAILMFCFSFSSRSDTADKF